MTKEAGYKPINSPIKWVGGKSRLRSKIIALLPAHTCYVEVFGGAGWVLFGKPLSKVEVLNDIDSELINFFRVVRKRPNELIAAFDLELVSREEFTDLSKADVGELDEIERAHRFYYLIMAGWGGELNYPRFQTSINDGGHGNRLIGALKYLKERITPVHERLKTVIIEHLDWTACIDRYDNEQTVFYLDPPYPKNGVNYFHNMRGTENHQNLADRLKATKGNWILSSYDTPEVRDMYKGFLIKEVESYSGMRTKRDAKTRVKNEEVLVMNYEPPQIVEATDDVAAKLF